MFLLNGQPLPTGIPFEVNGTQYPANWLNLTTLGEKESIGITEVADPESYDDRFYWGVNNPKDITQLKVTWTNWVNDTAWNLLQKTDYMDFRHLSDTGYTAPAAWVTWRAAIRAQLKTVKDAIAASTDVSTLQTAIAVTWTPDPDAVALQGTPT
jgi:hypothetical protein